jgi:hypothetical protein
MHLSTKVIRKTTIGVKDGEVCTTDVADAQLLVTRGTRGVGQLLEFTLLIGLFAL